MQAEEFTIDLFENSVPSFVGPELDRVYQNLYSSLPTLTVYGKISAGTSTYVARRNGAIVAVLLFRRERNKVEILNEVIDITPEEIDRFAHHVFSAFPTVTVITFSSIQTGPRRSVFPCQQVNFKEDFVLTLPSTADAYLASMGKASRKNIKYYVNRFNRAFPEACQKLYQNEEVSEQQVRDIIELNRRRFAAKKKVSGIDEAETQRIITLVKQYGFVYVLAINGRIGAGSICCRVGRHYFLLVNAHDPEYDSYRLDITCCYQTICECIRTGGQAFHFLWGKNAYKYQLLGVENALDDVVVYRSPVHVLLTCGVALQMVFAGSMRKAKRRLLQEAKQQGGFSVVARLLIQGVTHCRVLKQFLSGSLLQKR